MDITSKVENSGTFLRWFIAASLTGIEITEEIRAEPMIVTMQINGEEVNPVNSIERLEQQFDSLVKDEACEMLEDLKHRINERVDLGMEGLLEEIKHENR